MSDTEDRAFLFGLVISYLFNPTLLKKKPQRHKEHKGFKNYTYKGSELKSVK